MPNYLFGLLCLLILFAFFACVLIRLVKESLPKYAAPYLKQGQLGNCIFQILAIKGYAEKHGHTVVFFSKYIPKKTDFDEIKKLFPEIPVLDDIGDYKTLDYSEYAWDFFDLPYESESVVLRGYFQNHKYFPKHVSPLSAKEQVNHTYFLHVRAGDYLTHPKHFVDLRKYYARCIELIKKDDPHAEFLVFSNDNAYAENIVREYDIKYRISDTVTALDTMMEMSTCSGAICANSSLSWIGAFFQPSRKHIYMPSQWYNDEKKDTSGVYPPWAVVVDV